LTRTAAARYRWRVVNPELLVRGAAIVIGLLFGAIGTIVVLTTLGVFGDARRVDGTPWVGLAAGLTFILGGLAVIVGYGVAGGAGLEDDVAMGTRLRVRVVQFLLGLGAAIALAMIATWAALSSSARGLSAGAAAAVLWLFVGALGIDGIRRLMRAGRRRRGRP
jgi:hypothetical protein